jgi:GntR family transcriptional regulator
VIDQDPSSLYHQPKNILKSRILSKELKGNRSVQTEAELRAEDNVSGVVVRQALSGMIQDGLTYRDRGRSDFS